MAQAIQIFASTTTRLMASAIQTAVSTQKISYAEPVWPSQKQICIK